MAKKLKVDLEDIGNAMDSSHDGMNHYYLDTTTGKVILIQEEIQSAVEQDNEESLNAVPGWQKDMIEQAKKIATDNEKRYRPIPSVESHEAFRHMEDFVATVEDESLHEQLMIALSGKGAFGRFKRVLEGFSAERERWFKFRDQKLREEAKEFVVSLGIVPIDTPSLGEKSSNAGLT